MEAFNIGKSVNCLDVNLELKSGRHKPYRKPESAKLYVHNESSHAKCVINEIPKNIANLLSILGSDSQIFNSFKTEYENALVTAGYGQDQCKLEYTHKDIVTDMLERSNREQRKKRNR